MEYQGFRVLTFRVPGSCAQFDVLGFEVRCSHRNASRRQNLRRRRNAQVTAVYITAPQEGVLTAGVPKSLFQVVPVSQTAERNSWDVAPDGQRFLINQGGPATQRPNPITVVVNWLGAQKR